MTATSTELKRFEARLSNATQNARKPLERYASLYARTEILCAYTISRFGTNVPHALMDHIESMYLKKKKIMTFLLLIQVSPTQYCSFLNSHLYQKSFKWYRRRFDTATKSELHTIHQILSKMIRVKEKRDLVGIPNCADNVFVLFPSCNVFFYKKNRHTARFALHKRAMGSSNTVHRSSKMITSKHLDEC